MKTIPLHEGIDNWTEGRLPLTRDPVQIEDALGQRFIVSCPACGGLRGIFVARWRPVSRDFAKAVVARSDTPYGRPGNKEGERLKSKCCDRDIRKVDAKLICSHCLEVCEVKLP